MKAAVLKTVVRCEVDRGFESLLLRHLIHNHLINEIIICSRQVMLSLSLDLSGYSG